MSTLTALTLTAERSDATKYAARPLQLSCIRTRAARACSSRNAILALPSHGTARRAVGDDDDWDTDPDYKNEAVDARRKSEGAINAVDASGFSADTSLNDDKAEKGGGDDEADMTEAGEYHSVHANRSNLLSH